jgi:hypothetical protein
MRHARRALAASFVVTFAGGCDSTSSQPPAAPTVDVGPAPVPAAVSASASAAPADGAAAAPAPSDSGTVAALPPAPTVGRIMHNADGSCTWFPDRLAGRPPGGGRVIVNPPPPHKVQCPPGDGGT